MRIINKKFLVIIILAGVLLTGVLIFKSKEKVTLDNVILKQEVNNKTFAMYKEEGNEYVPVTENKFPDMYVLNIEKSKCIDNNGNELNGVLSYENDKVVLTTNKSSYCYLYFDKSLGLEIKEKESKGLKTDAIRGAMYRYQGQQNENVNNYICFGTSDKEECVRDKDKYIYRIIGIEASTGRVKVIKKEALNERLSWWDNYDEDIEFPESNIYKAINGDNFLTNPDYVPKGWEEKISNNTWIYGDMIGSDRGQTGEGLYLIETGQKETVWYNRADEHTEGAIKTTVGYKLSQYYENTVYYTIESGNWTDSFPGKISLMYLHDYYYSVSDEAICYAKDNYEICQTGWMNLSQNVKTEQFYSEWTMSRLGWSDWTGYFDGFNVDKPGYANSGGLNGRYSIRPVFYINASEELLSGTETGTIDDPFIIETSN